MKIVGICIMFLCLSQVLACVSRSYKIATNVPATVTLLDQENLRPVGDRAKTPHVYSAEDVVDRVLQVESPGRIPQFWLFPSAKGSSFEANLTLTAIPEELGVGERRDPNEPFRLLMKSYQALARNDLETAEGLAKELKRTSPDIAAPSVLLGLIDMRQGNNGQARVHFEQAKALDPSDQDIERLLNATP